MRNVLGHSPTRLKGEVAAAARLVLQAADMKEARRRLAEFSALRLVGALLAEKNEVWQEKKYLNMEAFKDWAAARPSAGQSNHLMTLVG